MNEKTEMMADMIKKLACLLIEQNDKLTLEQALATVFNSEIYGKGMSGLLFILKVRGMFFLFWMRN